MLEAIRDFYMETGTAIGINFIRSIGRLEGVKRHGRIASGNVEAF